METMTLTEMREELKANGYKNVEELDTFEVIQLWQELPG